MRIINISVAPRPTIGKFTLGRRGENLAAQVVFDISYLRQTYGEGVAVLLFRRHGDDAAYPVTAEQDEDSLTWTVSDTDTAIRGVGACELYWYVAELLAKSCIWSVFVDADIGDTTTPPPGGYESWVDTLTDLGAETLQNAQDAAASAAEAATYAGTARTAERLAHGYQLEAEAAKLAAEAAKGAAQTAQGKAEDAQAAAELAQGKAEDAQGKAETAQASAESAASAAETARALAYAAQVSAETAMSNAEWEKILAGRARDAAETAQAAAETAQGKAEDAQTASETAQAAAEGAEWGAALAKAAAQTAQTAAEASATSASTSASTATTKAGEAAASAAAASAAQTAAETAQGKAEDAQEAAEEVLDSIPQDYSELSADVGELKSAFESENELIPLGNSPIFVTSWESGGYNADGAYITSDKIRIKTLIQVKKGKTYTFKYNGIAMDIARYTDSSFSNGQNIAWGAEVDRQYTFANNYYIGIALRTDDLNANKPYIIAEDVLALKDYVTDDVRGTTVYTPSMEQGSISSVDGSKSTSSKRIRSTIRYKKSEVDTITVANGYQFMLAQYDSSEQYIGNTSWVTSIAQLSISGYDFTVVVRNTSDTALTPSTNTGITINLSAQTVMSILPKIWGEADERHKDIEETNEKIHIVSSTIDADAVGINQIARLGWKPYTANYPPEQSLASYKLAYDMGIRIMLADLRKTSDDVLVCIHDESINSVARNSDGTEISTTINVADHTLAELNEYDYGIYKGYPNEGILTLDAFLKLCGQLNCIPVIETKIWLLAEEVEDVCLMVRKYGLQDGFIWAEMPTTEIATRTCTIVRSMLPNATIMIRGGSYSEYALSSAEAFAGAGKKTILSFTDLDYLTSQTIAACRENNIDIEYSMVNTVEDMDDLYALDVFEDVRYWVSSEFNIHDYIMSKLY